VFIVGIKVHNLNNSLNKLNGMYIKGLLVDGGSSKGFHQEPQEIPKGLSSISKVKDKVLALLNQLSVLPGLRNMHKPGFIYLLEGLA